jgi:hypothetical protein
VYVAKTSALANKGFPVPAQQTSKKHNEWNTD